jgi:hypothetical protein
MSIGSSSRTKRGQSLVNHTDSLLHVCAVGSIYGMFGGLTGSLVELRKCHADLYR